MQIPLTKSFTIEHEFSDGKTKTGQFTTHKLTQMEKIKVGIAKSNLCGGIPDLGPTYDDYANAVAMCQIALTEKPAWFDPENLVDDRVLWKVYKEVAALEAAIFQPKVKEGNTGEGQDPAQ